MKRTVSILLLAALICGIVSCGNSDNGDTTTTTAPDSTSGEVTTADNTPKLGLPEDLKYDGYTFTFYGRPEVENVFIADEEKSGDTMNDAVWDRQQKVSDLLGVEFEYLHCSDKYANERHNPSRALRVPVRDVGSGSQLAHRLKIHRP